MHLSSLIFVLAFGLMINNRDLFFKGKLKTFFKESSADQLLSELKLLTLESSFLVRTFFFIVFGMSITLTGMDGVVFAIAGFALAAIFGLRFVVLNVAMRKDMYPAFYIAPRGLITVLLFFAIPDNMLIADFSSSILLLTIILSSLVMMYGLMTYGKKAKAEVAEVAEGVGPVVQSIEPGASPELPSEPGSDQLSE